MADQDIKLSELPVLGVSEVTDNTIFHVVETGLNYQLPMSAIKLVALNNLYESRPLGEMSLTAPASPQAFAGANFEKITAFDKVQFQRGVTVDLPNDSVEILEDGNYNVGLSINGEWNNSIGVEFAVMVDGVVEESLGTLQGRNVGKAVFISGSDIDPYVAGQIITAGAREDAGGSVDVTFNKVRLTVARV